MRATSSIVVAACLAVALTACSSSVQHQSGEAAPAGSPAPALLGPTGYGALKLGMTRQQAQATGLVVGYSTNGPNPSCPQGRLSGAPTGEGVVWYSANQGVVAITAYGSIATPQGVRLGMTSTNMRTIYPDWAVFGTDVNGRGYAKVSGNADAEYRIEVTNGLVTSLTLQANNEPCFE
ncbi:MAG: hypothetical protein ACQSGP_09715 [Frankia sp.]